MTKFYRPLTDAELSALESGTARPARQAHAAELIKQQAREIERLKRELDAAYKHLDYLG